MIRLFEAFAGYGSQALALQMFDVPYVTVGISEISDNAIAAHEALHGPIINYGDISKLDPNNIPDHDLFTYSFPCQDITKAGKRLGLEKGSGTRSSLLWECEKIIDAKRPAFLMMENVKDLVSKANKPHFDDWLNLLEEYGYNNYWEVIDASYFGIPQGRVRVFCVSIRKDIDLGDFKFEEPGERSTSMIDFLETEGTSDYILKDTDGGRRVILRYDENGAWIKNGTKAGEIYAKPFDSIDFSFPTSKNRRGRAHGYSHTLLTSKYSGIFDGENFRYLTERESLRLMGLTDSQIDKIKRLGLSSSAEYALAGNSIVVHMMSFLKNLKHMAMLL